MITVISDSHVPARSPGIPAEILERVEKADLSVHCGDFETREVYEELEQRSDEFVAVKGNCDRFSLQNSETFEWRGLKFGVYHGTGIAPRGDHDTLLDIAENKLEVDVLLHGHTHQDDIFHRDGTVLLNPGSCTGVGGGASSFSNPTMMELEVEEKSLEARILEKKGEQLLLKEKREFKNF